ncbi:MAG: ABC transporter substrate-binding protein [Acidobacteria bacterium]|nr:ABC transporter substrate-binding protein [Acidobacteriota bacterium]
MSLRTRTLALLGALCLLPAVGCGPEVPTVTITAIAPLTGEAQVYGQEIANGMQLRHERLLAGDEEIGYNVVLEVVDSEGDPAQAATLLETAFTSSLAAIGGVTSDEALAMIPVVNEADRVLLSPSASSPALSGVSEFFYRLYPSAEIEASTMATFLRDRLQVARLVVVAHDTAFGTSLADAIESVWGSQLAGRVVFTAASDQNAMVDEALGYDADAIYVAASGSALAEAMQALRLGGFNEPHDYLAASSSLAIESVLTEAGPAANNSVLTAPPYDTESLDEPVASFVAAYQEKHGTVPSYYAALGYDALWVYIEALSEVDAIAVPSDFLKGMRAVRELQGVTGNIQFRETGDVQKFTRIYQVVDGKLVDFEKYQKERREELLRQMQETMRQIEQANRN